MIKLEYIRSDIARITLNRPQQANALSLQLLEEFMKSLKVIKDSTTVRVVMITGAGEKVFCAGADLKERSGMNEEQVREAVSTIRNAVNMVEELPQPVIAAINGAALGGGLELSLACDMRIASETATLGLTEASLAIIPGAGGTQRLPRLIGIGRAKELIYTARRITAIEALEYGLVQYAVPTQEVQQKAIELAVRIAGNGPIAIQMAKHAISQGMEQNLATGLEIEKKAYEKVIPTSDRLEGLQAFKEKRKPVYKGE